jgi:hypothetical protein
MRFKMFSFCTVGKSQCCIDFPLRGGTFAKISLRVAWTINMHLAIALNNTLAKI